MKKIILFLILMIPLTVFGLESKYDLTSGSNINLNTDFTNYYFRYYNENVSNITSEGLLQGLYRGINIVEVFDTNHNLKYKFNTYVDQETYYNKLFAFLNDYNFVIDMKYITIINNEELTNYMKNYISELYDLDLTILFPEGMNLSCNKDEMKCAITYLLHTATFNIIFDGIYVSNYVTTLNINEEYIINFNDYNGLDANAVAYLDNYNTDICSLTNFTVRGLKPGVCSIIIENDYGEYTYIDLLVGVDEIRSYYETEMNKIDALNLNISKKNDLLNDKIIDIIKFKLNDTIEEKYAMKVNYEITLNSDIANIKICPYYEFVKEENDIFRTFNLPCSSEYTKQVNYLSETKALTKEIRTIKRRLLNQRYINIDDFLKSLVNKQNTFINNINTMLHSYSNDYNFNFYQTNNLTGIYTLSYKNEIVDIGNLDFVVYFEQPVGMSNNQTNILDDLIIYMMELYWEITDFPTYNLDIQVKYLHDNIYNVYIEDYNENVYYGFDMKNFKKIPDVILPTRIITTETSYILKKGSELELNYELIPINPTLANIIIDHDNKISTDSNLIKGEKVGDTTIHLTNEEGEIIKDIAIKIYALGDINNDDQITVTDLTILRKHLAGILINNNELGADITEDGKISPTDLVKIRRHLAGIEIIN